MIENKRSELFLNPSDSLKLNNTYEQYLSQYEEENTFLLTTIKCSLAIFIQQQETQISGLGLIN